MTCCVAAVCDNWNAIVMVADKMIGRGMAESAPDIEKVIKLHRDWVMMFAGEDISPVFNVADIVHADLRRKRAIGIADVEASVVNAYDEVRIARGIRKHLSSWGMDANTFIKEGRRILGSQRFDRTRTLIADFDLKIDLIIAGFDALRKAHLLMISDGEPSRDSLVGFCAIGSGGPAADYIMTYRGELSPQTSIREAVYYTMEGKYFGESAGNVSERTDLYLWKPGTDPVILDDDEEIEKKLIPLCEKLQPSELMKSAHIKVLNSLPLGRGVKKLQVPLKGKAKAKAKAKAKKTAKTITLQTSS